MISANNLDRMHAMYHLRFEASNNELFQFNTLLMPPITHQIMYKETKRNVIDYIRIKNK